MNHPEITITLGVAALAILLVAADILIRLVFAPTRKEKFVGELLDQLMGSDSEIESMLLPESNYLPAGDVQECLLRHFEGSATSRQILNTLSNGRGLSRDDLLAAINRSLLDQGKPPLPWAVVQRVAAILLRAGLVTVEQEYLRVTMLGQELNLILHRRQEAKLANQT